MFHFVLVFFSPFNIAITSLGEERANLSAFRTLIVALPGLFSYLFYSAVRSKAVVPVLVLFFIALLFILQGDLFYILPCVILFLCFPAL